MPNYYGVLYPSYWTGTTGRSLRKAGGKDALLLGAYLIANDHMNMIGLYRLPMATIRSELGLSIKAIDRALQALRAEQFAFYDPVSSYVWVREMARFRLGIDGISPLAPRDKKRIGAERLYRSISGNPFLGPFFDRYRTVLQLNHRREESPRGVVDKPLQVPPQQIGHQSGISGASEELRSGFEAASKPVTDQVQVQQKDQSSPAAAGRPRPPAGTPKDNIGVITKIAHEAIEFLGPANPDLAESVKSLCARRHIAYDSHTVRGAIESALVQRGIR